ncbi:MAG TPA: hypothetical protein VL547_10880, partial [Dinghuibacter sp.]|uniref:hypothetical protein n=1 Tax=Dinghuibacter sp. TaxID=2024697 RepID=UPI002C0DAC20
MTTNKRDDIIQLAEKINVGIHKAVRKLIEREAALGGNLVVGDDDGFKTVPAKDVLRELNEEAA